MFTNTPFTGNPAGVVLVADGLTNVRMLVIARELNNSETAFVLPADGTDHDVRVRFFTPTTEVRTCGHATVATHFARAVEYGLPSGRWCRRPAPDCCSACGSTATATECGGMHQGAAVFGPELDDPQADRLLRALGAAPRDLAGSSPVQIVSTGHAKVLVELRDHAAVDALRPDPAALTALSRGLATSGFFVFTRATGEEHLLTWSRMFAPAIGVFEDPATGNGRSPLGAYLLRHGIVPAPSGRPSFTRRQGPVLGRPETSKSTWRQEPTAKSSSLPPVQP
ncbi:putative isomerase [Streptomyces viridiviolaceus]|uniref:PhzF family phenazine biosynthesis isomerase n=1 Tax=Streptomyces viridiviolaceus TaxID=68282 RepID=A0ABW2E9N2_9ACTN|nr:PhzF family phenazine biosynthesis isomerase [Streptomyces viridiviolaceus]GHB69574.1 putative isomerase [Streptomyces viridiviolaceus]